MYHTYTCIYILYGAYTMTTEERSLAGVSHVTCARDQLNIIYTRNYSQEIVYNYDVLCMYSLVALIFSSSSIWLSYAL